MANATIRDRRDRFERSRWHGADARHCVIAFANAHYGGRRATWAFPGKHEQRASRDRLGKCRFYRFGARGGRSARKVRTRRAEWATQAPR